MSVCFALSLGGVISQGLCKRMGHACFPRWHSSMYACAHHRRATQPVPDFALAGPVPLCAPSPHLAGLLLHWIQQAPPEPVFLGSGDHGGCQDRLKSGAATCSGTRLGSCAHSPGWLGLRDLACLLCTGRGTAGCSLQLWRKCAHVCHNNDEQDKNSVQGLHPVPP